MSGPAQPRASLSVTVEHWPIAGAFVIARGVKREAVVVVAILQRGAHEGRGECAPYARYGESVDGVVRAIEGCRAPLADGLSRAKLQALLPAGAARNALDCALWDLEAKTVGKRASTLAGIGPLRDVQTCFTLSLDSPEAMAARAKEAAPYPLIKLKLGAEGDEDRLAAVRRAVPKARLIVDANEAWRPPDLERLFAAAEAAGVELIEQPLPADHDAILARVARSIPICADESAHDRMSLPGLVGRYNAVNIKLDKTGGLTEALATASEARRLGLRIMVGCMVATSLAMAPALLVAQGADWVDLDGPLLLACDREPGLTYRADTILPPPPGLWG